jgi:hypothetical protein
MNIYIFTFPNGKQYVGQSTNIKNRYKSHKNGKQQLVDKVIKKYGWDNIKKLEMECSEDYLDWMEIEWIKELNSISPNGYNLDSGGNTNKHLSKETKKKISLSNKGKLQSEETKNKRSILLKGRKSPMKGKNHSIDTIEKMKKMKNALGYRYTDNQKNNLSQRLKGNNFALGSKRTKEFSENLRKAMKGENNPNFNNHKLAKENNPQWGKFGADHPASKRIKQFTEDNIFIKEWASITQASKTLNINPVSISKVLHNKGKKAGKFIWRF